MSSNYWEVLRRRALSMLSLAKRLVSEGEYDLAVLNAEYAAQLYLKSLLYRLSGEEWRGRSIRTLLGALSLVLHECGLDDLANVVYDFVRSNRRLLAELDEAHTRAVYGPLQYSREQAGALLKAAELVIDLLKKVEEVFRGNE